MEKTTLFIALGAIGTMILGGCVVEPLPYDEHNQWSNVTAQEGVVGTLRRC